MHPHWWSGIQMSPPLAELTRSGLVDFFLPHAHCLHYTVLADLMRSPTHFDYAGREMRDFPGPSATGDGSC